MPRLGRWNAVRRYPSWHYGVFVRDADGNVVFTISDNDGRVIEKLHASPYRTTALARKMGKEKERGYEQVAQEAIRAFLRKQRSEP